MNQYDLSMQGWALQCGSPFHSVLSLISIPSSVQKILDVTGHLLSVWMVNFRWRCHMSHPHLNWLSLKQSGWCWYQKLSSIFLSLRFHQCSIDQAVFHKSSKNKNEVTVVAVHIDDCTIVLLRSGQPWVDFQSRGLSWIWPVWLQLTLIGAATLTWLWFLVGSSWFFFSFFFQI